MDVVKPNYAAPWSSFYWIGLPLAIFILICTLLLWAKLNANEFAFLQQQLQDAGTITVNPIENAVDNYIDALVRMGKRWNALQGTPEKVWYDDAENYYDDAKIFQGIEWVDTQMRIRWVVPPAASKILQGVDLSKDTIRAKVLEQAREAKHPVVSSIITLMQGPKGFLIILPLYTATKFDGYLVAGVSVEKLFHQIFINGLGDNYGIAIYQDKMPVFSTGGTIVNPFLIQQKTIKIYNIEWQIYIWPTAHLLQKLSSSLPNVVLGSGATASILVLIIFYLYNKSRFNAFKMTVAKRESERSAERLRKIIETVNVGFLSFDERGTLIDWNPYAEKILGWSKQQALGKNVHELVIPERHRQSHRDAIHHFIKTGEHGLFNREVEFKAIKSDGSEFPVEVVTFPLKMDEIYTFHSFVRDISPRKKAEADQAQLTSIIDASDDAIVSTSLTGHIRTWNKGAENLYGYKAHEVIDRPITIIYEDASILGEILEKIKKGEHIKNYDTTRKHRDGHIIPVSVVITPIRDKSGAIIGNSSITRDITELKKIEKIKNEFISIVSHELRTPLTSIRGSLGLLIGEKIIALNDKAKQLLEIANNNCERLVCLINDILDIEKIEAGKMEFNFKLIDLNKLINEAIETNQHIAARDGIKLEFSASNNVIVKGDYERLMQVMNNFLSNAIHYSPQNGVIKISLENEEDKIRVSVADHGPGIPEAFHSKVFSKFMQADSSSTRKKGGTGLGLSICKAIIEKHQGIIGFSSIYGQGAIFYFELPLHNELTQSYPDQFIMQDKTKTNKKTNHKLPDILSVEDDLDVTQLVSLLLQDKALVWNANTMEKAKQMLNEKEFDLVLLDLNLPDGYGTALMPCVNYKTHKPIPTLVFSIDELDKQYTPFVKGTLLKSKVTNEQLCQAIESAINSETQV